MDDQKELLSILKKSSTISPAVLGYTMSSRANYSLTDLFERHKFRSSEVIDSWSQIQMLPTVKQQFLQIDRLLTQICEDWIKSWPSGLDDRAIEGVIAQLEPVRNFIHQPECYEHFLLRLSYASVYMYTALLSLGPISIPAVRMALIWYWKAKLTPTQLKEYVLTYADWDKYSQTHRDIIINLKNLFEYRVALDRIINVLEEMNVPSICISKEFARILNHCSGLLLQSNTYYPGTIITRKNLQDEINELEIQYYTRLDKLSLKSDYFTERLNEVIDIKDFFKNIQKNIQDSYAPILFDPGQLEETYGLPNTKFSELIFTNPIAMPATVRLLARLVVRSYARSIYSTLFKKESVFDMLNPVNIIKGLKEDIFQDLKKPAPETIMIAASLKIDAPDLIIRLKQIMQHNISLQENFFDEVTLHCKRITSTKIEQIDHRLKNQFEQTVQSLGSFLGEMSWSFENRIVGIKELIHKTWGTIQELKNKIIRVWKIPAVSWSIIQNNIHGSYFIIHKENEMLCQRDIDDEIPSVIATTHTTENTILKIVLDEIAVHHRSDQILNSPTLKSPLTFNKPSKWLEELDAADLTPSAKMESFV